MNTEVAGFGADGVRRPGSDRRAGTVDVWQLVLLALGFAALYAPTYVELARHVWSTDEQGHGPIILAASAWMFYQRRQALVDLPMAAGRGLGAWGLMLTGLLVYWVGQSQSILLFAAGSQILVIAGLLVLFRGSAALRVMRFPLLFLLFMVPLPGTLVAALTAPLKAAVSTVASSLLYQLGYPVGRSGVVLQVGQYQMLVADACSGLNSIFSLEALGLLYMNVRNYTSALRNTVLAVLLVPISFCANVVRVLVLVLVTYHFGDAAGRGFVHGFAGIVLFLVAIVLMLVTDRVLDVFFRRAAPGAAARP
jgi:exosortase B